jgi:hypothetical protein
VLHVTQHGAVRGPSRPVPRPSIRTLSLALLTGLSVVFTTRSCSAASAPTQLAAGPADLLSWARRLSAWARPRRRSRPALPTVCPFSCGSGRRWAAWSRRYVLQGLNGLLGAISRSTVRADRLRERYSGAPAVETTAQSGTGGAPDDSAQLSPLYALADEEPQRLDSLDRRHGRSPGAERAVLDLVDDPRHQRCCPRRHARLPVPKAWETAANSAGCQRADDHPTRVLETAPMFLEQLTRSTGVNTGRRLGGPISNPNLLRTGHDPGYDERVSCHWE